MNKRKAIMCTTLFVIVLTVVLIGSSFVKTHYEFSLYDIIIVVSAHLWIAGHIEKFYKWLIK